MIALASQRLTYGRADITGAYRVTKCRLQQQQQQQQRVLPPHPEILRSADAPVDLRMQVYSK